jgi:dihydroorotase
MLKILNAVDISGKPVELSFNEERDLQDKILDAKGLTVFPGLIDPHVHFRTPGLEYKEDWTTASKAALCGGYTTVFDMPNTLPPTITEELLREKKLLINTQLKKAGIPLRYHLFFGADKNHLDEIPKVKQEIIGIKIFMGCSTGNLVIDDDESLEAVFALAAAENLLVAVHAEDEAMMNARRKKINIEDYPAYFAHSVIRNTDVAVRAVEKALSLCRRYKTRLYILHVSCAEEIALIKKARQEGLPVFAETTPHHLFLNDGAYQTLRGKAVVNPPLRENYHQEVLFEAIREGIIDTIGSDHAPHTVSEKSMAYPGCPSGMPGIETTLALLLNAWHQNKLSLENIISLTSTRAKKIFNLNKNTDIVLVDLNKNKTVSELSLKTKCQWSAFEGMVLKGWPRYVVMGGKLYDLALI